MGIFGKLFSKSALNPEDEFITTINDEFVKVEPPSGETCQIKWHDIKQIKLINTDEGPLTEDIWLILSGSNSTVAIPHGARGFNQVFDIISKYDGFDFDAFTNSMTSTENAEFILWTKK
jgi:hypothetical protein